MKITTDFVSLTYLQREFPINMTTAGHIYCALCGLCVIGTSFIEFNGKRCTLG